MLAHLAARMRERAEADEENYPGPIVLTEEDCTVCYPHTRASDCEALALMEFLPTGDVRLSLDFAKPTGLSDRPKWVTAC